MPCYYSGVKKYQAQNALEYQASVTPAFAEQRCSTPAPVPPRRAPSHSRGSRSRKLTRWLFPPEPPAVAHTQAGAPDPGSRLQARGAARPGGGRAERGRCRPGPPSRALTAAARWALTPRAAAVLRCGGGPSRTCRVPAGGTRFRRHASDGRGVRWTDRSGPPPAATWSRPAWPRWRRPELSTRCGAEVSARRRGAGGDAALFPRRGESSRRAGSAGPSARGLRDWGPRGGWDSLGVAGSTAARGLALCEGTAERGLRVRPV